MAISMVRKPSETPIITNIDDFVSIRYAYGGQNGYVLNKGNEISNTVNGNQFVLNSGRLVLDGVEVDIDANGVIFTADAGISETRYFTCYLEVNLYNNNTEIKFVYDSTTYPVIDKGDDLTKVSTGTARLVLYKFVTTNGVISNVQKVVSGIKYVEDLKVKDAIRSDIATKAETADYINLFDPSIKGSDKIVNANSLAVYLSAGTIYASGTKSFNNNNDVVIGYKDVAHGVFVTPILNEPYSANIGTIAIYLNYNDGWHCCRDNSKIIGFNYFIIK